MAPTYYLVAAWRQPRSAYSVRATSLDEVARNHWWEIALKNEKAMAEVEAIRHQYEDAKKGLEQRFVDKVDKLQRGDELPPGVMKMVKVFVAVKRKIQPGDKMAGRHGNKGVVSKIVPIEDMPFLEDGTHADIVLNPLGVPSRMNVGQILETHLGWACAGLGKRIGQTIDAYYAKQDIKPLKETLRKIYGDEETIKSLNDAGYTNLKSVITMEKGDLILTPSGLWHEHGHAIEHELAEEEKHCSACQQDLRPIGEESSERYEYIPAQLLVIEDVCKKYACACTVKTATKPSSTIHWCFSPSPIR